MAKKEKKMTRKQKLAKWMNKHCLLISVCVVAVVMAGLVILILTSEGDLWSAETHNVEKLLDVLGIVSAFFVIFGTLIAVLQYYISSKGQRVQIQKDKIEKSIDLAEYYKDNILTPYSVLKRVYIPSGIYGLLSTQSINFKEFDYEEMAQLFTKDDLNKIEEIQRSEVFFHSMVHAAEVFSLDIKGYEYVDDELVINKSILFTDFISKYVTELTNSMEFFAMYYTHNVADESVVYESLHPSFLEICKMLYWDISKCSQPGKSQLFRNVTMLYNLWLEKDVEDKQKRSESKKNNTNYGAVVETF